MRAIVVQRPNEVSLADVAEPAMGEYEALVRVRTCTLCSGTDRHIAEGSFPGAVYPCILGHETIGQVEAVGQRVRNLKAGDLVLRPIAVRPGHILSGYASFFGGFSEIGVVADAGALLADARSGQAASLPAFSRAQQVVPAGFPLEQAGAFITYKEALSSLGELGVRPSGSLLILGSGPVALNLVLAAKRIGARPVIVTGRRSAALERALAYGADAGIDITREDLSSRVRTLTEGAGAAYAVEAIGSWPAFEQALPALAAGGVIGIYGVAPDRGRLALDVSRRPAGLTIRFLQPREQDVHAWALDQMRLGLLDLAPQVTHRLPFEEYAQALALAGSGQAVKVVLTLP